MFWQSLNLRSSLLDAALRPRMPARPPRACRKRPCGQEHGMGQFIQSPSVPAGAAPRCVSAGRSPVLHPSPAVQKAEQKSRAENHTSSPPESSPRGDSKLQAKDSPKRTPAWPYRASPSSKPFVFITTEGTRRPWGPAAPATHRQMVLGTRRVPPTSWDPACAGETRVLHPGACWALTAGANTTPRSAPRQNARCWPP